MAQKRFKMPFFVQAVNIPGYGRLDADSGGWFNTADTVLQGLLVAAGAISEEEIVADNQGGGGVAAQDSLTGNSTTVPPSVRAVNEGLSAKADAITQGAIAVTEDTTDFFNVTIALHGNRPTICNHPDPVNAVFAASATVGATAPGAAVHIRNTGAGTITATGACSADPGCKLTAATNEVLTAEYDSVDDTWRITTPASATVPSNVLRTHANITPATDVAAGTTATTIVQSFLIPGGTIGPNGKCQLDMFTSGTGTAGLKGWSMYIGPSGLTSANLVANAAHVASYSQGSTLPYGHINIAFRNKNAQNSQVGVNGITGGGAATGQRTGAVDTSVDQTLYIALAKGASGDVVNVECGGILITPGV